MRILLLILAFASPNARAFGPAPPGPDPVPPVQAAPTQYLPLTPELLARWGYDTAKVIALPPAEKLELQKQLTLLEIGRLRRIELLQKIKPDAWKAYLDEKELITPEGMKLIDDWLAAQKDKPMLVPAQIKDFERKDGKPLTPEDFARAQAVLDHLFDGVAAHTGKDMSGDVVVDAHVRNETVMDMTITNPKSGLSVSVGQLFVDDRHPQATNSPYANLTWGADSKPDSWVDYRFKASLGYVDLHSRYFADGPSAGLNEVFTLGQKLGLPQDKLDQAAKYVTYDDPYQAHGIIVTSLLSELGRAYNLFGPVDLSWTVGGLVKTMWVAPNAAFDETLGLRVRLNGGLSLGFFGGVTQNVSPVGNDLFQQLMTDQRTIKAGLNVEQAPHASVALWGKVPGASDVQFSVSASQRWNETTSVHSAEGSLMTTFYDHPLTLRGSVSQETGTSIEYGRRKEELELDYQFSDRGHAFVGYQHDKIIYGNAKVNSDAFLAGLKIDLGKGGSSLTIDQLMGGQYIGDAKAKQQFQQTLNQVNRSLTDAVNAVDKANQAYQQFRPDATAPQMEAQLNALSAALARLDPATAGQLIDQLGHYGLATPEQVALANIWLKTVPKDNPYYQSIISQLQAGLNHYGQQGITGAQTALGKVDDWSKWFDQHKGDVRRLIGLLTDQQVWDAAVVQAGRAQLIIAMKQLGKVSVPVMGKDFTLQVDAPAILAASNILNSRLSPVAPVKESQVDAWLMGQAGKSLGLSGDNFTDQQIAAGLFGLVDKQMKDQLSQALAPLSADIANATPAQLAAKVLAAVPPNVASALQQQYGQNLSGLIPSNLSGQQLKDLLGQLPDRITGFLEKKYGAQLASGVAQAISWAGDLISRQINMTMIQLMLASEELNRLTVDHGRKIDDLDLRMAMRSFTMLDERGRDKARDRIADIKDRLVQTAASDDQGLAQKFHDRGVEVLAEMQLDPSWPQGLTVQVDEKAWMPLMTLYGDGRFFDLVTRLKERYKTKAHPGGIALTLTFSGDKLYGASIWKDSRNHTLKLELGRPKDARDAEFKLSHLEDYVDEL